MFALTTKTRLVYVGAILIAIAVFAFNIFSQEIVRIDYNKAIVINNETPVSLSSADIQLENDKFYSMNNVTNLEINGNKSTEIPSSLFEQTKLEKLTLRYFDAATISADIRFLYKLTYLDLASSNIDYLPDEISKLNNLKEIHLSYNKWQYRLDEVRKITRANIILE